jgi:hypothetical protein
MPMFKNVTVLFFATFLTFVLFTPLQAQVSSTVSRVNITEAKEGQDFQIGVELVQSVSPQHVTIYYRAFGESEFKQAEMNLHGALADYVIPGSLIAPPYIEYYLVVTLQNGTSESYPLGALAQSPPLQIRVSPNSPKDKEVIVLSPERNKFVGSKDFFISISLLRASSDVDKAATKVYVDNIDITPSILFADDMLLFYADNFPQKFEFGKHDIKIELYDNAKKLYHTVVNSFSLVSDDEALEIASGLSYRGEATAESRNENVSNVSTWYHNLDANLSATYKNWDLNSRVYLTSEEKNTLQPNDRFSLDVHSDWLSISAGDHNPNYPSLIVSGKRLRGITGAITLGAFNIETSYGQISRSIEGSGLTKLYFPNDTLPAPNANLISLNPAKFNGAIQGQVSQLGTYSRNMFAVRPYFGKGDNFQFGLTYLHSADDPGSINLGARPAENIVLGTDLLVGVDDQHILLTGQAAVSLSNSDISSGNLSDSTFKTFLNSVDKSLNADDYINYKNTAEKFMTINQFLKPLNIAKLSSLAAEGALAVNYFDNYLKGSYIYRGSDFESFANSYLRTNIAGINVMDRVRLLENKLFVSLGYEDLQDNLKKITAGTTTFKTYSGSVSYFPGQGMPNFLVSYLSNTNQNDISIAPASQVRAALSPDPVVKDTLVYDPKVDEQTNRITLQASYDFTWYKHHNISLSYSVSERDDKTLYDNDATNYSINLLTSTSWDENLETSLNITLNHSSLKRNSIITLYKDSTVAPGYVVSAADPAHNTDLLDYTSIAIGGKYFLLNRQLSISAYINPTFGDFQRLGIDLNSQYFFQKNFSLQLRFIYMVNSKLPNSNATLYNDSTIGLIARYGW